MKEKELIQKIESLKSMKPNNVWKQESRVVLLNQISNSGSKQKVNIFIAIKDFFAQPSFAVVFVLALFIVSSVFGIRAVKPRPGDSLYIAQIISEKAQLAMTFNEEKYKKLEMKFANDRAKLIAQLLSEASLDSDNEEKSIKLTEDFKKEINIVKDKIQEIKLAEKEGETTYVVGANLGKDENGLEITDSSDSNSGESQIAEADSNETEDNLIDVVFLETEVSSSTVDQISEDSKKLDDTHKKLEEAEELFNQKDYDGVFDKLEEVNILLNEEELNDFSESATSTEE